VFAGLGALALVLTAWVALKVNTAGQAGYDGKEALESAESSIAKGNIDEADAALDQAERSFAKARSEVRSLGPFRAVARQVPLVRTQVRAAESFAGAGLDLTAAARRLTITAHRLLEPNDPDTSVADAVKALEDIQVALDDGVAEMRSAAKRVTDLDGKRLFGTLQTARDQLSEARGPAMDRAEGAQRALDGALAFLGADGERNWLVVTQNPDEPRPLGGFIGTVGLMRTDGKDPRLVQHDGVTEWQDRHRGIVISYQDAPPAFSVPEDPEPMRLANTNATYDWPSDAATAMQMWNESGEPKVDGVLSLTPEAMARVVKVLGRVPVPGYSEVLTSRNLLKTIDFHVHDRGLGVEDPQGKQFIADAAEAVLDGMLDATTDQWVDLARALGDAFDGREAMGYSTDPAVAKALAIRGWDAQLPSGPGDFVGYGEFAYEAKNGRGLVRTFRHDVDIHADGSATVRTEVEIANTDPYSEDFNPSSSAYAVMHGPVGSSLGYGSNDWFSEERPVEGHPGAGWVVSAPPGGTTTFVVEWDVPQLVVRGADGRLAYRLDWWRVVGNRKDRLNLNVQLPDGWSWAEKAPPETIKLQSDISGEWRIDGGTSVKLRD
jgi:hypothetical protein